MDGWCSRNSISSHAFFIWSASLMKKLLTATSWYRFIPYQLLHYSICTTLLHSAITCSALPPCFPVKWSLPSHINHLRNSLRIFPLPITEYLGLFLSVILISKVLCSSHNISTYRTTANWLTRMYGTIKNDMHVISHHIHVVLDWFFLFKYGG